MLRFQFTGNRNETFAPEALGGVLNRLLPQARTSHATWPVWSDSSAEPIKFSPLPKKSAVRLYHQARDFERKTRQPGQQDGALGRNGLKVFEALIFDFLNYATGQLWPSVAAIARKAGISERSARRGLDNLKAAGVLAWQRRKDSILALGQILWFQLSNAYQILTADRWRGYTPPADPPPPHGDAWGAAPPLPSGLERACEVMREREQITPSLLAMLEEDERDECQLALARLARAMIRKRVKQ
jgi:hypothetical protein